LDLFLATGFARRCHAPAAGGKFILMACGGQVRVSRPNLDDSWTGQVPAGPLLRLAGTLDHYLLMNKPAGSDLIRVPACSLHRMTVGSWRNVFGSLPICGVSNHLIVSRSRRNS